MDLSGQIQIKVHIHTQTHILTLGQLWNVGLQYLIMKVLVQSVAMETWSGRCHQSMWENVQGAECYEVHEQSFKATI